MQCQRCQAPAPEDATFCEKCGARLEHACPSCGVKDIEAVDALLREASSGPSPAAAKPTGG